MIRYAIIAVFSVSLLSLPAVAQHDDKDKNLDVRSPIGDLHVGKDADAKKAGLPLYPGARQQKNEKDDNSDSVNLALLTENLGMNLIVAKYETDDPAEKVLGFYRDKMKKYGKVLECHNTNGHSGVSTGDSKEGSKPVKCDGDNSGPVRELKVGTEDNQHIVAIEDPKSGKATTFVLIYLRKHESGDI